MTDTEALRLFGLFCALVVSTFWAYKYMRYKYRRRGIAGFILSWMLHSIVFYVSLIFFRDSFTIEIINIWSHALKIQGYITLIIIGALY